MNIEDFRLENNGFFKGFKKCIANDLVYNATGVFEEVPLAESSLNRLIQHINYQVPIMLIGALSNIAGNETREQTIYQESTEHLIEEVIHSRLLFVKFNIHWESEYLDDKVRQSSDVIEDCLLISGYKSNGKVLEYEIFQDLAKTLRDNFNQRTVILGNCIGDNIYDFKYLDSLEDFIKIKICSEYDVESLIQQFSKDKLNKSFSKDKYECQTVTPSVITISKLIAGKLKKYENNIFNYYAK